MPDFIPHFFKKFKKISFFLKKVNVSKWIKIYMNKNLPKSAIKTHYQAK